MNALLPIIEELADARDDRTRARWLLSCPLAVLFKYQHTIINRLRIAFFAEGVAYVEAELALARRTRVNGLCDDNNAMLAAMWRIAGVDPFGLGDEPGNITMPVGDVGALDL